MQSIILTSDRADDKKFTLLPEIYSKIEFLIKIEDYYKNIAPTLSELTN